MNTIGRNMQFEKLLPVWFYSRLERREHLLISQSDMPVYYALWFDTQENISQI